MSGTPWAAMSRAQDRSVPSPPTTTARSARAGRSSKATASSGGVREASAVRVSISTDAPRSRRTAITWSSFSGSSVALLLPTTATVLKGGRMGPIKSQRPWQTKANPRSGGPDFSYNVPHAERSRAGPAQDPRRALHRGRPARRLAGPRARFQPGALPGHDQERHGRPRGDGLRREPAHLGRARADAEGLPVLRRHAAHRAPPRGSRARADRGEPPAGRPAPRRGGRLPAAVGPHAFRGRGDVPAAPRGAAARRVHPPLREARHPHHRRLRRGGAEPRAGDRPALLRVAARRGRQCHQPELRRPRFRHHREPRARRAPRPAPRHLLAHARRHRDGRRGDAAARRTAW